MPSTIIFHTQKILIHCSTKVFPVYVSFFRAFLGEKRGKFEWGEKIEEENQQCVNVTFIFALEKGVISSQNYFIWF